ncbi:MAG: hypothetical protein HQ542_09095 [Bacteroidia bacterium]|nr:hypothetical protein [Bacteroidia bacterium]
MKALKKLFWILLFLLPVLVKAEVKEIPFTLDDRDRIIRTEQKVESLQTDMNARFEQLFNFLWPSLAFFFLHPSSFILHPSSLSRVLIYHHIFFS